MCLFREIVNLDCHLFTVHKLEKLRSSSAQLNCGLLKKQEPLLPTKKIQSLEYMRACNAQNLAAWIILHETVNHIAERDSDGELDWLAEEFNAIYKESNNTDISQKGLMDNIEEERDEYLEYNNEDLILV